MRELPGFSGNVVVGSSKITVFLVKDISELFQNQKSCPDSGGFGGKYLLLLLRQLRGLVLVEAFELIASPGSLKPQMAEQKEKKKKEIDKASFWRRLKALFAAWNVRPWIALLPVSERFMGFTERRCGLGCRQQGVQDARGWSSGRSRQ